MVLNKISISRKKLESAPRAERIFFVQIGQILNELNTLQKVIFIAAKYSGNTLERRGRHLQALFFSRILAGKLAESWELLGRDFFGAKLSKEYEPQLSVEGKNSLDKLKRYFSNRNLIHGIRNDFAFHYTSPENIEKQLEEVPSEEVFELLIAPEQGNCLYSMSDVIVNFSLLNSVDPNPWKAMDIVLSEIFDVTKDFLEFLSNCLVIIADRFLAPHGEPLDVGDPPLLADLTLPFFVGPDKEKADSTSG